MGYSASGHRSCAERALRKHGRWLLADVELRYAMEAPKRAARPAAADCRGRLLAARLLSGAGITRAQLGERCCLFIRRLPKPFGRWCSCSRRLQKLWPQPLAFDSGRHSPCMRPGVSTVWGAMGPVAASHGSQRSVTLFSLDCIIGSCLLVPAARHSPSCWRPRHLHRRRQVWAHMWRCPSGTCAQSILIE